jgi:flavin reductase (DIM6/NTAB) family NADH-FMN oxidoreductase RutF
VNAVTAAFDGFVALLDYPVYIVTAAAGGEVAGCLVGFASQCSLDPPRFAVWISKANHTYEVVERADVLVVHVLAEGHALAELFGGETGDRVDKFAEVPWTPGPAGIPVLDQARAWFAGRVEHRADWGDHVGYSLEPIEGGTHPGGQPLSFRDVADVEAGHPA